jgi:hypothetical protein
MTAYIERSNAMTSTTKEVRRPTGPPRGIQKIATGIEGMDEVLNGGITTVMTSLTAADTANDITGIDLSSVIDTAIVLRNVDFRESEQ